MIDSAEYYVICVRFLHYDFFRCPIFTNRNLIGPVSSERILFECLCRRAVVRYSKTLLSKVCIKAAVWYQNRIYSLLMVQGGQKWPWRVWWLVLGYTSRRRSSCFLRLWDLIPFAICWWRFLDSMGQETLFKYSWAPFKPALRRLKRRLDNLSDPIRLHAPSTAGTEDVVEDPDEDVWDFVIYKEPISAIHLLCSVCSRFENVAVLMCCTSLLCHGHNVRAFSSLPSLVLIYVCHFWLRRSFVSPFLKVKRELRSMRSIGQKV